MSGCGPVWPIPGSFAGVPTATLQQWLLQAQTARNALMTGAQAVTVSYGEGDGQKTVTYHRTNVADLDGYIRSLMRALGIDRRRAVGVRFA